MSSMALLSGQVRHRGNASQAGRVGLIYNLGIGPSNLSVSDPSAIKVVLGNSSKCIKSQWYSRSRPLISLHTVREKKPHDVRRKVFSKAFTSVALQAYEKRVNVHCEEWIRHMKRLSGQPFDATDWMKYFGKL